VLARVSQAECCQRRNFRFDGAMTARRFTAFLVALIAFAAVAGQFALDADAPGLSNWVARLWDFARYFTYLTLCMAMVHMGLVALGRPVAKNFTASVVLCVIIVGIVYWTLLAPDKPLEGWHWYTNMGLHLVVPVGAGLWWLAFGSRGLRLQSLPLWLIWPLVYCIYALIRGEVTGAYPYFFLDVGKYGMPRVLENIVGLLVGFTLVGAVLWAIDRALGRRV
jgi:hypothetical protein